MPIDIDKLNIFGLKVGDEVIFSAGTEYDIDRRKTDIIKRGRVEEIRQRWFAVRMKKGGYRVCIHYIDRKEPYMKNSTDMTYRKVG